MYSFQLSWMIRHARWSIARFHLTFSFRLRVNERKMGFQIFARSKLMIRSLVGNCLELIYRATHLRWGDEISFGTLNVDVFPLIPCRDDKIWKPPVKLLLCFVYYDSSEKNRFVHLECGWELSCFSNNKGFWWLRTRLWKQGRRMYNVIDLTTLLLTYREISVITSGLLRVGTLAFVQFLRAYNLDGLLGDSP